MRKHLEYRKRMNGKLEGDRREKISSQSRKDTSIRDRLGIIWILIGVAIFLITGGSVTALLFW